MSNAGHPAAQCLNVDVSSFGESEDDAVANLSEALGLYFEDAPEAVVAPTLTVIVPAGRR